MVGLSDGEGAGLSVGVERREPGGAAGSFDVDVHPRLALRRTGLRGHVIVMLAALVGCFDGPPPLEDWQGEILTHARLMEEPTHGWPRVYKGANAVLSAAAVRGRSADTRPWLRGSARRERPAFEQDAS